MFVMLKTNTRFYLTRALYCLNLILGFNDSPFDHLLILISIDFFSVNPYKSPSTPEAVGMGISCESEGGGGEKEMSRRI